ncbi:hypothetical protein M408DRAFT_27994 [Serendipita vermifera MAFF 305830]|uniref:Uncharacterized protein n=1 Tax=Serendipita vermifera MAFF 305830 TaxID=933852 RepID=A0A0C3AVK6_SERVB|nr:hypothetical protein M408DRAFT_27994 [Serendipita vermifera MAFF 305830]
MFVKPAVTAALLQATSHVLAQRQPFTPLASKSFTYTNLPYQVDPIDGQRGRQWGYNICNSTTEIQEALFQTAIINSVDAISRTTKLIRLSFDLDFCLWGAPEPNGLVSNVAEHVVAWCTKPGHGTRVIPAGAITGLTFVKTPDYVQVTSLIHQAYIDIESWDAGGEWDPHGPDRRGNPLGGLLFTNAFASSNGNPNTYVQAVEWHSFMGGDTFCLKACDSSRPNAARYCDHIYDRLGCYYNAPASYAEGVFERCLGDSQDFPGVYTGRNGVTSTWIQPPESLGPITSIPYAPKRPASSQCSQFTSSDLFSGAPAPTPTS